MTEQPLSHKKAYTNLKTNFVFHEEIAEILPKIINKKGILNNGRASQSVYRFAKKYNSQIKKAKLPKYSKIPKNQTMNTNLFKKIIS